MRADPHDGICLGVVRLTIRFLEEGFLRSGGGRMSSDGDVVLLSEESGGWDRSRGCRWYSGGDALPHFREDVRLRGWQRQDALRTGGVSKVAAARTPVSGRKECSPSTKPELENPPFCIQAAHIMVALVDVLYRAFPIPPAAITFNLRDTGDALSGRLQRSLSSANYKDRCSMRTPHLRQKKPQAMGIHSAPGQKRQGVPASTASSNTSCAPSAVTGKHRIRLAER